ncbi:enoyl-CoA hydratase [Sulfitobacter sabulilitoris]|uniref:Enoyl-CoA hydratase n=1 Tax=Sulfitobacter sabulilitoris TaxID=2562655 RepID=A0A5S3PAV7_9RHOB|nr:enoyl-CoA hydratase [Sulfitobacter sabulilitoris]TMM50754.1 enoyl-CoA hydratase [Sulfitobacter sabulilitoris]
MTARETTQFAEGRLLVQSQDGIGRITFNNPARMNAMSLAMWDGLRAALDTFEADDTIRVVVLNGAGDKAFVSGADISEFDRMRATPAGVRDYNARSEAADLALYTFPKPTIAEIKGFCIGGGMGLAIACDLRICAEDTRMGITAGKLGLGYGYDGVRKLTEVAGPSVAAEVLYSAQLFTAQEAKGMGLVNRVVPRDGLEEAVTELARRIAANAPLTVEAAKAAIRAVTRPDAGVGKAQIDALTKACFASEDYAEGRRAFAEKRKPSFTRR